jgi:hypothetical protein
MRKLIASAAVLALGAVFAVTATAQDRPETTLNLKTSVSPNKAGTPKKPQGVRINFTSTWTSQPGFEPPIITSATALLPKAGKYNGGKYPKCSASTMNRGGLDACPKKSIMGKATGVANADTAITRPKITIVNGGANKACFYTQLTNPARVNLCAPVTITKIGGKDYGYRVKITVPKALQVVAGVPITLRSVKGYFGGMKYAKNWIETTSCPKSKKWAYSLETDYLFEDGSTDSASYEGTTSCR